jgi:hypothetical protein
METVAGGLPPAIEGEEQRALVDAGGLAPRLEGPYGARGGVGAVGDAHPPPLPVLDGLGPPDVHHPALAPLDHVSAVEPEGRVFCQEKLAKKVPEAIKKS